MLVLSRNVGEKIVINEDIVLTVAVIGVEFCDVEIRHSDGRKIGLVTLQIGADGSRTGNGVWGHVLRAERQHKVRLGFECPPGVTVRRAEVK